MRIIQTEIDYTAATYADNVSKISISGAQEKLFAVKEGRKYRLAREGEQSLYIIKPVPDNPALALKRDLPVNEYLTMQVASRIFKIKTAENQLICLADGSLAYMTRRFDVLDDGTKLYQEDFASLSGRSAATHGTDYKYEGSYLEVAKTLRGAIPAWKAVIPVYFKLVLFNYLFSNGDAHWKNFSIFRTKDGVLELTPAYDLVNTSLHIRDDDFALSGGLGTTWKSDAFVRTGHPCKEDFICFAKECGLTESQIEKAVAPFMEHQPQVETLCEQAPLSAKARRIYIRSYNERLARFLREK